MQFGPTAHPVTVTARPDADSVTGKSYTASERKLGLRDPLGEKAKSHNRSSSVLQKCQKLTKPTFWHFWHPVPEHIFYYATQMPTRNRKYPGQCGAKSATTHRNVTLRHSGENRRAKTAKTEITDK